MGMLELKEEKKKIEELKTCRNLNLIATTGGLAITLISGGALIVDPGVPLGIVTAVEAGCTAIFASEAYKDGKALDEARGIVKKRIRK